MKLWIIVMQLIYTIKYVCEYEFWYNLFECEFKLIQLKFIITANNILKVHFEYIALNWMSSNYQFHTFCVQFLTSQDIQNDTLGSVTTEESRVNVSALSKYNSKGDRRRYTNQQDLRCGRFIPLELYTALLAALRVKKNGGGGPHSGTLGKHSDV